MPSSLPVTVLAGAERGLLERVARGLLSNSDTPIAAVVPTTGGRKASPHGSWIPTRPKLERWGAGCSCCTVRSDVVVKTRGLLEEGSASHVLLVLPPGDELDPLVKAFTVSDPEGRRLGDEATVRRLLVVASLTDVLGGPAGRELCERIELADEVVLLTGEAGPDAIAAGSSVVAALNPSATLTCAAAHSDIALDWAGVEGTFDLEASRQRAESALASDTAVEGVSRRAFEAVTPFHPQRLSDLLQSLPAGVYRMRGLFWVASRPGYAGMVDAAGTEVTTRAGGVWWAAMPESRMPDTPAFRQFRETWHPVLGDRVQQLVLIGEPEAIQALETALEECLVTQEEVDASDTWHRLPHPFPWPADQP